MILSSLSLTVLFFILVISNENYKRKTWAGKRENIQSIIEEYGMSIKVLSSEIKNLEKKIESYKKDEKRSRYFLRDDEFSTKNEQYYLKNGSNFDLKEFRKWSREMKDLRKEEFFKLYEIKKKEIAEENADLERYIGNEKTERMNLISSLENHVRLLKKMRDGGIFVGIFFVFFSVIYIIVNNEIPVTSSRIFGIGYMFMFSMMSNLYIMLRNLNNGAINIFEKERKEKEEQGERKQQEPVKKSERDQHVDPSEAEKLASKMQNIPEEKKKTSEEKRKTSIFKELTNEGNRLTSNVFRNLKIFAVVGAMHGIIFGILLKDFSLILDILTLFIISQFFSFYMFNSYINMDIFTEHLNSSFHSFIKQRIDKYTEKMEKGSFQIVKEKNAEKFKTLKYIVMLLNYYVKKMCKVEITNKDEVMYTIRTKFLSRGKKNIDSLLNMLFVIPKQDILFCFNIAGVKNQFKESNVSKLLKKLIPLFSAGWTIYQLINLMMRAGL